MSDLPIRANGETRRKRAKPCDGLCSSDIDLISYVYHFCRGHADLYVTHEVFSLPMDARRRLLDLLQRLDEIDQVDADTAFRMRCSIGDDIHAWARRWERGRRVADAFLMPYDAWRTVHTVQGSDP